MLSERYHSILICTDGSPFSEGALREGIQFAKKCGASITALTVLDYNPEFEALAPGLSESAEKFAGQFVKDICVSAEKESVPCKTVIVRNESPYLSIANEASDVGADLIVMGRRGRTGLKRLLMGSIAKGVIGHAPCSVLIVPREAHIQYRNILAATDGSRYGDAACEEAAEIARESKSALTFISIVPAEDISPLDIVSTQMHRELATASSKKIAEDAIIRAQKTADAAGVKAATLIYAGTPYQAIIQAAAEKKADLIVMGSHGRTGIDRLLMGSVAERVVGHAECATLVVKIKT